ncbi:MAG: dihydroorotate dehydrogenase 2 [Actinomycetota bacterium]
MDWYSAVGHPLFFALPPETAHRLAGVMLGLPLPWARIGHAADDPSLRTAVAGLPLRNPIGLAAGFDKACAHLDALAELGFGYVVGGTLTREPRAGNPKPRIVRYPAKASMANAMGLPNPGAERAAAALARRGSSAGARLVSVADEAVEDVLEAFSLLEPHADGVELNASCPNVSWGRDRDNEAHLRALVTTMRARSAKPLFVKLPPFTTGVERDVVLALASIAQESGASGLTCSNTRPVHEARLSMGGGGLSGRALWERTPSIVAEVRTATGGVMPINACGGISTADEILACFEAGAATVQVYSALIYGGPGVVGALTHGLARALHDRHTSLRALAGTAEPAA